MAEYGKPATADEADRAVRLRVVKWIVAQEEDINEAYTARLRRLEAFAKRRGLASALLEAITIAPIGPTPVLREWHTRDHLSAISAISPEGKLYFHSQDHALNSGDVVAFLEHLLRELPGRMVILWDGAPIHRSHLLHEFLAHGAAPRLHLERLPAYAPELNPGEGLWHQLKGVELRNLCCFNIPHLRGELRHAVKRVRRKLRLIKSFFRGAKL